MRYFRTDPLDSDTDGDGIDDGVELYRLSKEGERATRVHVKEGPLRLAPEQLGDRAINEDGRVLVPVTSSDTWYWGLATLSQDGTLTRIAATYDGDLPAGTWCKDGKTVVSMGYPFRSELWRFTAPK